MLACRAILIADDGRYEASLFHCGGWLHQVLNARQDPPSDCIFTALSGQRLLAAISGVVEIEVVELRFIRRRDRQVTLCPSIRRGEHLFYDGFGLTILAVIAPSLA